ncbi:peptidyl-prolyl cis-trans isomerase CYP19-2-like [Apium graveolens]|uniref:peptidyl-prolyl cis-trans isomerase CYP19-2-like n=1 Tax=Apium graveolens TaxID=4045 RepID=UPI003D7A7E9E
MENPMVFFDITFNGEMLGRIEMELYADICPITAENFRALCTGEKGIGRQGKPLHYKGSDIQVEVGTSSIIEGDIYKGGKGESIYGTNFNNENQVKIHQLGSLSMFNGGKGIGSQFIISPNVSPSIDVLNTMRNITTSKAAIIADCGQIITKVSDEKEVFFDIAIGGTKSGRIIMKLFDDTAPKTVDNFRALCTGGKAIGKTSGKTLHYKGTTFQHIIPGVMCHGGDFTLMDGSGGEPITGADKFLSEDFEKKHTGPGVFSMVNTGNGANGSQFFICTTKTDWLDGKHVVFGEVVQGMDVVKAMENVGLPDGTTTMPVTIIDCGQIKFDYPEETIDEEEPY